MEEAKREDLTVLVYCLPLKAVENDIWGFFKKEMCGKVRDIRIIKDPRSLRSKGVAYVEFYTSESVQKALMTDGRLFEFAGRKSELKLQHSQAEKNRAAAVAVKMRIHRQV